MKYQSAFVVQGERSRTDVLAIELEPNGQRGQRVRQPAGSPTTRTTVCRASLATAMHELESEREGEERGWDGMREAAGAGEMRVRWGLLLYPRGYPIQYVPCTLTSLFVLLIFIS